MPRLLLQLAADKPLKNPTTGVEHLQVAGDFETADENNFVAATVFGKVAIPQGNVDYRFVVADDVVLADALKDTAVYLLN